MVLDYYDQEQGSGPHSYSGATGTRARGTGFGLDAIGAALGKPRNSLGRSATQEWFNAYTGASAPMPTAVGPAAQRRGGTPAAAYEPPGAPWRFTVDPFSTGQPEAPTDPFANPLGVIAGMSPGLQRGGIHPVEFGPAKFGIATTPVTMQNFITYAREGVLSAMTSALGHKYQQTNAFAGEFNPDGPANQQSFLDNASEADFEGMLDNVIDGVTAVGDKVFGVFDQVGTMMRNWSALNRTKSVRDLYAGRTVMTTPIDWLITSIFSGGDKYHYDMLMEKAAEQGKTPEYLVAKLYDLSPEQVNAIRLDPNMSDATLEKLSEGTPYSNDPIQNMLTELAIVGGMFIIPGMAAPRLLALGRGVSLGLRGAGAADGFVSPLLPLFGRGTALGQAAMKAGSASTWTMGKAWQANKLLTASGAVVRGGEWGIKQMAEILGNDELVATMDRWLWETPLSNNPGLQIIDAFSARPLSTFKDLKRGRVDIGMPGGPTNLPWGPVDVTVGGMVVELPGRVRARLGKLEADMTFDAMQKQVFDKVGWTPDMVKTVFANPQSNLGLRDIQNALVYFALAEVRRRAGGAAAMEFLEMPTIVGRSQAWVTSHMPDAVRLLADTMAGKDDSIVKLLGVEWWERGGSLLSEASPQGAAGFIGPYDPHIAIANLRSWLEGSKVVDRAIREGRAEPGTTLGLRGDVSNEITTAIRSQFKRKYKKGTDLIEASDLNLVKTYIPTIGDYGRGAIKRKGTAVPKITRNQLFRILDEADAAQAKATDAAGNVPTHRVGTIKPDATGDPVAVARGTGVQHQASAVLRDALDTPPEELGRVPESVLGWLAKREGKTLDDLRAEAPEQVWSRALGQYGQLLDEATLRGAQIDSITRFASWVRARAGLEHLDQTFEVQDAAAMKNIETYMTHPPVEAAKGIEPIASTYATFLERIEEATTRMDALLEDPARDLALLDLPDGPMLSVDNFGPQIWATYEALILRASKVAGLSDVELATLESVTLHPFDKAGVIAKLSADGKLKLSPTEAAAVARVEPGIAVFQGDIARVLGPDVPVTMDNVAAVTKAAEGARAEAESLRAELRHIANVETTVERGGMSDELHGILTAAAAEWGDAPTGSWRTVPVPRGDVEFTHGGELKIEGNPALAHLDRRIAELENLRGRYGSADLARQIKDGGYETVETLRGGPNDLHPGYSIKQYGNAANARAAAREAAAKLSAETGDGTAIAKVGQKYVVLRKVLAEPAPEGSRLGTVEAVPIGGAFEGWEGVADAARGRLRKMNADSGITPGGKLTPEQKQTLQLNEAEWRASLTPEEGMALTWAERGTPAEQAAAVTAQNAAEAAAYVDTRTLEPLVPEPPAIGDRVTLDDVRYRIASIGEDGSLNLTTAKGAEVGRLAVVDAADVPGLTWGDSSWVKGAGPEALPPRAVTQPAAEVPDLTPEAGANRSGADIPAAAARYRIMGPGVDKSGTPRSKPYIQIDLRPWEPGDKGSWRWLKLPDPDAVIAHQRTLIKRATKKGDTAGIARAEKEIQEQEVIKARWAAGDLDYHPELDTSRPDYAAPEAPAVAPDVAPERTGELPITREARPWEAEGGGKASWTAELELIESRSEAPGSGRIKNTQTLIREIEELPARQRKAKATYLAELKEELANQQAADAEWQQARTYRHAVYNTIVEDPDRFTPQALDALGSLTEHGRVRLVDDLVEAGKAEILVEGGSIPAKAIADIINARAAEGTLIPKPYSAAEWTVKGPTKAQLAQPNTPGYRSATNKAWRAAGNKGEAPEGWNPATGQVDATIFDLPEVVAPEAKPPVVGAETVFRSTIDAAPDVPARYRVVELDDLLTNDRPGYPQHLQLRDRARLENAAQAKKIAREFRSDDSLRATDDGSIGPQIVRQGDAAVVSGNGRTMAMRQLNDQQYAAYRGKLKERAAEYGLTPEQIDGMERPVLVREIADELATTELATRLNEATGGQNLSERARAVSDALTLGQLEKLAISEKQSVESALKTADGVAFVNSITEGMSDTAKRALYSNGELTGEGVRLIKTALLSKVIRNQSTITHFLDAADESPITKLRNGIMDSVGQLAHAKELLAKGKRWAVLDITPDLSRAIEWIDEVRMSGGDPLEGLGLVTKATKGGEQGALGVVDATATGLTAEQRWLAEVLWKLGGGQSGSAKQVREFLQSFARKVIDSEDPHQTTMFGAIEPDLEGFLRDVVTETNRVRAAAAEGSMFGPELLPQPPNSQGSITLTPVGETATGNVRAPVTASQAIIDEAGLGMELEGKVTPGTPLRLTVEPEQLISISRQIEEASDAIWTTGDDALDAALSKVAADPARARVEWTEIVRWYEQFDEPGRATAFDMLVQVANEGTADAAQFLLLRKLSEGGLRRAADGRYNPTRATFVRDLLIDTRGLIDLLQGQNIRGKLRIGAEPAAAGDTVVIRGARLDVDAPEYRATTGLEPDMAGVDAAAAKVAESNPRVLVTSENRPLAQAIVKARGGKEALPDGTRLLDINEPDQAAMLTRADQLLAEAVTARETAVAQLEAYHASTYKDISSFTDPEAQALWGRLMHPGKEFGPFVGDYDPMSLGQVADAIGSIDNGMIADLTPAEAATLRAQLIDILRPIVEQGKATRENARMVERTGRVERGGPRIKPAAKAGAEPEVEWRPATVPDDLELLARELRNVVQEDPNLPPLEGFDGTQYVLTKAPKKNKVTGEMLAPRIFYGEDLISMADRVVPGMGDELLSGPRRKTFEARTHENIVSRIADWVVGGREESAIRTQAIAHFKQKLLGPTVDILTPDQYQAFEWDVKAIYRAWRAEQESNKSWVGVPMHRRIGLIPMHKLDEIAETTLKARNNGNLPGWYAASGVKTSEAWRFADNRLRQFIRGNGEGDLARMADTFYDSRVVRKLGSHARGFTPMYHLFRFAMDIRWLALELTESPLLAAGRSGVGAAIEGTTTALGKTQAREPFLFGRMAQQAARENWAHWMAVTDVGAAMRLRDRYLMASLRREQPEVLTKALRELASKDSELSSTLRKFGDTPEDWLSRLDRDWQAVMAKSKPISEKTAREVWGPFLKDGTIDKVTYDRLVAARRYTPVPAIEQAITESAGDVRIQRLYKALEVKNNELWNDLASVFYGQADRSNLQRALNHPLLYWPISYQIKATKWLANILFDKAFGVDTGAGGAWTVAEIHNRHMERMSTDAEYADYFVKNKTLLFIAQMVLPITPFDIGVSMSPFTRLVLSGQFDEAGDQYSRNIIGVGPGYTFFSLLPRFIWEQSKPGAVLEDWFGPDKPLSDAQRYLPPTLPIKPSKKSTLDAVNTETIGELGNSGVGFDRSQYVLPDAITRYGP